MVRLLLLKIFLLCSFASTAQPILVNNIEELNNASKNALPGAVIVLRGGIWNDVTIKLNCKGTKEQPITFKAHTPGNVILQGQSRLALGGDHIIVDGFFFKNGYAGEKAVIEYRSNQDQLANNCRITNCWIEDFNNPNRMDENYWVAFYGKNNQLDHCSFTNKKNMGVLLAVILDDDRSRENFHSIDHNYFGKRIPLASNGGEIIRVGVSQHCQFNSNTQIVDNFFEHCDGETEIVSIKSGSNLVKNNLFKECQGGVVLRHGDNNTVENNIFLGNDKPGTGGVRIINKGQWVVNNFFYKCRGVDFRSPLSIMNGIPNSPANRYVQVTDAVIANNTFYECSPISFGEGSDAERTLPPDNVLLINNVFYNTKDTTIVNVFDKTSGFRFVGNEINSNTRSRLKQNMDKAFLRRMQTITKSGSLTVPLTQVKGAVALPDSLGRISQQRLGHWLSTKPGVTDLVLLRKIETTAQSQTGVKIRKTANSRISQKPAQIDCPDAGKIISELKKNKNLVINLTGKQYEFDKPLLIMSDVQFIATGKPLIRFSTSNIKSVFMIAANARLSLKGISIDGAAVEAGHFISSDDRGSAGHYSLLMENCTLTNFSREQGCMDIFYAYKDMVADSLIFRSNNFSGLASNGIMLVEEKEDKGYYNAEKIVIANNKFNYLSGTLADIYRGGNDESTMGPQLIFTNNSISNVFALNQNPLIILTGVQVSRLSGNSFTNSNNGSTLVKYVDRVRARHIFEKNSMVKSGGIEKNNFVTETRNIYK